MSINVIALKPMLKNVLSQAIKDILGEFNITSLFSNGEQGVWYDPNDLTTLFQDSAGTTPVTAAGQPVGLMLDKSKGLTRGGELWISPTLGAEWSSLGGGAYRFNSPTGAYSELAIGGLSSASTYEVAFTVTTAANLVTVRSSGLTQFQAATGTYKIFARGGSNIAFARLTNGAASDFTVSGISVRELPGNHAAQPTAASRPILRQNATTGAYYLETDGVDDWMSTSAIDFTGTDKVSVFAGVRKLSDAVFGLIASQASWYIGNKTSGQYEVSRTGGVITAYFSTAAFPAPNSSVVAFSIDYAAGNEIPMLRVSGVPQAVTAGDSGSGNIGLGPLYIGRLNGTSLPFNGHFYGLTIVGRLTTDTETRSMERLLANNTGVTLT